MFCSSGLSVSFQLEYLTTVKYTTDITTSQTTTLPPLRYIECSISGLEIALIFRYKIATFQILVAANLLERS